MSSTVRDLRDRNRASVLRHIVRAGETTRSELATSCGLSAASVTNVVTELVREGLVQETGSIPSDGGRPIARISTVPGGVYVVGAQVGEDGVTAELFDLALNRLERIFKPLPRKTSAKRMANALVESVRQVRAAHPQAAATLWGVGLGLPGIVESHDGEPVLYAQNLGWGPVSVGDMFAEIDVPIFCDNAAKTLAIAERWFGAARGVDDAFVALVGRGIGGAIVSQGQLQPGATGSAGEWGHSKIAVDGAACQCGGRGCLEAYVGGGAIVRTWRDRGGRASGSDEQMLGALIKAADGGDPLAISVLDESARILSVGLANAVNVLNPTRVIVGGWAGLALLGSRQPMIEEHMQAQSLARPGKQVSLTRCRFDDAVPLGAALLPLENFIDERGALRRASA